MITEAIQGETVNSYTPQQGYDLLVSAYNYSLTANDFSENREARSILSDHRMKIIWDGDIAVDGEKHMVNYHNWVYVRGLQKKAGEK